MRVLPKRLAPTLGSLCLLPFSALAIAQAPLDIQKNFLLNSTGFQLASQADNVDTLNNGALTADSIPALNLQTDGQTVANNAAVTTSGLTDTVAIASNNTTFFNLENGQVAAELFGISARGVKNTIHNTGLISGDIFAVNFDIGSAGNLINNGVIASNGRAVHVAGSNVTVINNGEILGTGKQFDGTLYLDSPGENISVLNNGLIDAGVGNNGAGASFEIGDTAGDTVGLDLVNVGNIQGQGTAAEGAFVGDGVRVFSVLFPDTVAKGKLINRGEIIGARDSSVAVGISIENNVRLTGGIINHGLIAGTETAIDAQGAGGGIHIINTGKIAGNILLSAGNDTLKSQRGHINGTIDAGAGDDIIFAGKTDDIIVGGEGSDRISGGRGRDTVSFADRELDDFTIQTNSRGQVLVTDTVSGDIDTLSSIEVLSFSDQDVDLSGNRLAAAP